MRAAAAACNYYFSNLIAGVINRRLSGTSAARFRKAPAVNAGPEKLSGNTAHSDYAVLPKVLP